MKKLCLILLLLFIPISTAHADSGSWFNPMTKIEQRATIKGFGDYIDNNFYATHPSSEFPNHFYGYHAAQDLEALTNERDKQVNVPVYFISSGTISYIGNLSGYGGVVLVKLDGTNDTALYGHVKTTGMKYSVGEHIDVTKPTILTYLGNGFSSETSGERKHLHFGVYRGQDLYFRGHEASLLSLNSRWHKPLDYLKEKDAKSLDSTPLSQGIENEKNVAKKGLIDNLLDLLRRLFKK